MIECACGCGGLINRESGLKYIHKHTPVPAVVDMTDIRKNYRPNNKKKYVYIVKWWPTKKAMVPVIWKVFSSEGTAIDFVKNTPSPSFYERHEVEDEQVSIGKVGTVHRKSANIITITWD